MPKRVLLRGICFCATILCGIASGDSAGERSAFLDRMAKDARPALERPSYCLTPGATAEDLDYVDRVRASSAPAARFNGTDNLRWKTTATNGTGLTRGQPITLTWSIVPDDIPLEGNLSNSKSNLKAKFDAAFGSRTTWVSLLTSVFNEWGSKTGITFVRVGDDGAAFPSSAGKLGSRGDIRIGGFNIDGSGAGVLAYNYFPNMGDMVLDTGNTNDVFKKPQFNYRLLRNVVAHELGHGMGFDHVCPQNETKIMEAFITLAIDHSAVDDIANGNRKYGDPYEKGTRNDIVTNATAFGSADSVDVGTGSDPARKIASLDSATDVDFHSITLSAGETISVRIVPVGGAYDYADDTGKGCAGKPLTLLAAGAVIDLSLQLIGPDGFTVLEQANAQAAGYDEFLLSTPVASGGTYFVRVYTNDPVATLEDKQVQLYTLSIRSPGEDLSEIPAAGWLGKLALTVVIGLLGTRKLIRRRTL